MELQYAMFCADVTFPDKPQGAVVLTKPVSSLTTQNITDVEFPLFLTFISCVTGRHDFKVEVSNFSGDIITTRDFNFSYTRPSLSHAECFLVKFPIHKTDLLTFSMFLDGKQQGNIKLPIKVES